MRIRNENEEKKFESNPRKCNEMYGPGNKEDGKM